MQTIYEIESKVEDLQITDSLDNSYNDLIDDVTDLDNGNFKITLKFEESDEVDTDLLDAGLAANENVVKFEVDYSDYEPDYDF